MAYRLRYSDYSTEPETGPPDPTRWQGPPGPLGPQGVPGPEGPQGVPGNPFPEAPNDGAIYGRGGATVAWTPTLPLSGGSLSGPLLLGADPAAALGAATKQYVDATITRAGGPFLPLIGGTVSGATTFSSTLASGAQTINGAATITGTNMLQVGNNAGVNNFIRLIPAAAGATPGITVVGVDANAGLNITPQGTGYVTIPRLLLGGANFSLSGTFTSNQSPLSISTNVLGTSTDPYRNITQINVVNDNVNAAVIQGFGLNHNYGGTAAKGSRIAFSALLYQNAATQNTANTFYQGGNITAQAFYQEPGSTAPTRTGALGIVFALGTTSTLGPSAINYSGLAGQEADIVAGAQPFSILGLSVVRLTGGYSTLYQAAEPSLDSGFRVGSGVANSAAWVNGYTITSPTSQFALDATKGVGFIIFPGQDYQITKPAAKTGIDLSYIAFNNAAYHSQGAIIDGAGNAKFNAVGVGNWNATLSSAGLTIDRGSAQVALTAVVASGGTPGSAMAINEQFSFAGNGRGIVTSVAGGVVTGISVLEYPTATSPPANPVSTTSLMFTGAGQATGTGLTLNLTWSAASALALNPSGGQVTAPTPTAGSNNSQVATTAYVDSHGVTTLYTFGNGAGTGNGADTTEDTLVTFNIPAATLKAVGDRIRIYANGGFTSSTDSKTARVRLNNTAAFQAATGAAAGMAGWSIYMEVLKTGAGANSQVVASFSDVAGGNNAVGGGAAALNDTSVIVLTVTGQNTTNSVANSIAVRYLSVEYIH